MPGEAGLFQRVAGHLLNAGPTLRPSSETILRGAGGQPGLWPMGISGDLPIVLLRIADIEHLDIVRQLLQAHEYWRMKQFAVDLVILNERASSYVAGSSDRPRDPGPGEPVATAAAARSGGAAASSFCAPTSFRRKPAPARVGRAGCPGRATWVARRSARPCAGTGGTPSGHTKTGDGASGAAGGALASAGAGSRPLLEFFNGLGGFAEDGREYVTILGPGQATPAPWINVIANPVFGFQVATEGSGFTWSVNSRENQLTPWSNDPVSDRPGEVFYLRDDDTGDLWCPTALPIRDDTATYVAWHGWGYSRFDHAAHGIAGELLQYVPLGDPIKISRLTLRNTSRRMRHLSLTAYVEWVLGPSRGASVPFVTTEIDPATGAMFARNPWNAAFGSRVAFADLAGRQTRLDGRPAGVHRSQRDTGKPGGARWRGDRSPTPWAPVSIPAARCEDRSCWPQTPASKSSSSSAKPRARRRRVR